MQTNIWEQWTFLQNFLLLIFKWQGGSTGQQPENTGAVRQKCGLGNTLSDMQSAGPRKQRDQVPFRIWNLEFSKRGSNGETHCLQNSYYETSSIQQSRSLGKSQSWKIECPQFTHVSSHSSSHGSSLLDRQQHLRTRTRYVNPVVWSIFLNTTLQAAGQLGQDCEVNSRFVKNHFWNSVEQLFNETGKLISEQKEITCVTTIDFQERTWRSTSSLCQNLRLRLCLGKMEDDPIEAWKNKN